MKSSTKLSSAVFQLTPTRTRCDLFIIANDKKEKIASGLLNPFLAHLKAAQDQISKGGYSILLEPNSDAEWFTKATVVRFVRFVSTPEILERVYIVETEILQIEEAINMQGCDDIGQKNVEDHQQKPLGGCEGAAPNANEEKSIVLYKPGDPPPEANGSCSPGENSRAQLLKVFEARKKMLQKEQGMTFARAVAAGFDIDQMPSLISFAEFFGAFRLLEACSRFVSLWKTKHETGQWVDVQASEEFSTQSNFSAMNASGIILSATPNKHDASNNGLSLENGNLGTPNNADNPVPNDQQEYFQGQFPHLVFPPWPMHAPPGAQPVFQPYPVQGMPYYQAYAGGGPFFQPQFGHQSGQERQSSDVRDSNSGSEKWEIDRTRSLDDMESDGEVSESRKLRKKSGGSNKKKPGVVVIRNINYITKKSGSETTSDSHSDTDTENEYIEGDDHGVIHQNSKRSSKSKGNNTNFNNDEVSILEKDSDDRRWLAFQNCLLSGSEDDAHADKNSMFEMGKGVKTKRRTNTLSDDPLSLGALRSGETQDSRMRDISRISGSMSRRPRGSGDEVLFSNGDNGFRRSNDQMDFQFAETNARNILSRTGHEDIMIGSQQNQSNFRNSSDSLAVNSFEVAASKMDRESSSHEMGDENFIAPFRSMSFDQVGGADRTAIDMDCEISSVQKLDSAGHRNRTNYEPDDMSFMPERGTEKRVSGYDLALDYEMQVCAGGSGEKKGTDVKGGMRKSDKDRKLKASSDPLHKQRTGGPIRKIKPSKMSPLEDARARAEMLRSYKADLQKIKKEKEEAEAKRIQALKMERQRRIAARGGGNSTSVKPSTISPQTKQFATKLSPATNRGSKFSDSGPGSSSPLQRSKIRTSLRSKEPVKSLRASKVSEGSQTAGNRLTRSASSLSEQKREIDGVVRDPKVSMARIRRLSEPKTTTNPPVTSIKPRSAEHISKRKLSDGPEKNRRVSAIIDLGRSKAATLPELKIKTSKSHVNAAENTSAEKDPQIVNGIKPSKFPENGEVNVKSYDSAHEIDADDNPIVEKTVVMLECHKPSFPTLHSSKGKSLVRDQHHDDRDNGETPELVSAQLQSQSDSSEVRTAPTAEKPYLAPYARVSSLEDPCTRQSEYGKAPVASLELLSRVQETVKANVSDVTSSKGTIKVDKHQVTSETTVVKEPSKGLSRLLRFGKKNHNSSSLGQSVDSECTSCDGVEHDDNAQKAASTSEVFTLKNLISQDETSSGGNAAHKTSRHFSLLSPFRSKTSEKKQAS